MSRSLLPHRALADIDERMEHAAAKPAVLPETIVADRGMIYESETFRRSCELLGSRCSRRGRARRRTRGSSSAPCSR
jgi:hypothetical protein